jgi:hypothetical protein
MDENFTDTGPVIEISPFDKLDGPKPADYSARLAAALKVLGKKYCLYNPRYAVNKNRVPTLSPKAQPVLAEVKSIKGRT